MNITPINNKIHNLLLKEIESKGKSKKKSEAIEAKLNIDSEIFLNQDNHKIFRVRYKVNAIIPGKIELNVEYDFDFRSDVDVDMSLPKNLTMRSKVPNLTYPYIKSYIENFIMMSGYGAYPLPYIDFIKEPMPDPDGEKA